MILYMGLDYTVHISQVSQQVYMSRITIGPRTDTELLDTHTDLLAQVKKIGDLRSWILFDIQCP